MQMISVFYAELINSGLCKLFYECLSVIRTQVQGTAEPGVGCRTPPAGCVERFLPVGSPCALRLPSDCSKGEGDLIQLVSHPQGKALIQAKCCFHCCVYFGGSFPQKVIFFF